MAPARSAGLSCGCLSLFRCQCASPLLDLDEPAWLSVSGVFALAHWVRIVGSGLSLVADRAKPTPRACAPARAGIEPVSRGLGVAAASVCVWAGPASAVGALRAYPARVRPCARGMPRRFRPAWSTPRVRAPAPACGRGSARVQGASKRNESRLFRRLRACRCRPRWCLWPACFRLSFRSAEKCQCERPLTFCRRSRRRPGPENRPGAGRGQNRAAGPVLGRKRATILRLRTFGI